MRNCTKEQDILLATKYLEILGIFMSNTVSSYTCTTINKTSLHSNAISLQYTWSTVEFLKHQAIYCKLLSWVYDILLNQATNSHKIEVPKS